MDESCTSDAKSEHSGWTAVALEPPSNLKFQISDLRCRICPFSDFQFLLNLSLRDLHKQVFEARILHTKLKHGKTRANQSAQKRNLGLITPTKFKAHGSTD